RGEGGEARERAAALLLKAAEGGAALGRLSVAHGAEMALGEAVVELGENRLLQLGDRGVVDQLTLAQRGKPRRPAGCSGPRLRRRALGEIRRRFDVDVERIEEEPARRRIGATVPRLGR